MRLNKKKAFVVNEEFMPQVLKSELTLLVSDAATRQRLDIFLAQALAERGYSREQVKDFIKKGCVLVNNKQVVSVKYTLVENDLVHMVLPEEKKLVPQPAPLTILYEDASFAVINKPSELTVHPCPNQTEETLVHRLLYHFPTLRNMGGERPGIVHRLDKDTTGLLLVALTENAHENFTKRFAQRQVYKEYLALVHGVPQKVEGSINAPIGRDPNQKIKMCVAGNGKEALTQYRVLFTDDKEQISLLAVQIITGRTHQIRVHLEHLGHPILGDFLYSTTKSRAAERDLAKKGLTLSRPMLHAWRLGFTIPKQEQCEQEPFGQELYLQEQFLQSLPTQEQCTHNNFDAVAFMHKEWVHKKGDQFFCYCLPPEDFQNTLLHFVDVFLPVVITGLPGCGKSTLLAALQKSGQPVISADAIVAEMYLPKGDGTLLLKGRFGQRFIVEEDSKGLVQGSIDKRKLGAAMIAETGLRKEVEMLIHPLVYHKIHTFWGEQESNGYAHAFAEIPLYFEGQSFSQKVREASAKAAYTIGVSCSSAVRHKRLLQRGWNKETIESIDAWHLNNAEKMQRCDTVIDNETLFATPEGLHKAVLHLINIIKDAHEQKKRKVVIFFDALYRAPLMDTKRDE